MGDIVKKSNTPRLAIENSHNALPIEMEKILQAVIYDTSLENTLSKMKTQNRFSNIEKRDKGDIF